MFLGIHFLTGFPYSLWSVHRFRLYDSPQSSLLLTLFPFSHLFLLLFSLISRSLARILIHTAPTHCFLHLPMTSPFFHFPVYILSFQHVALLHSSFLLVSLFLSFLLLFILLLFFSTSTYNPHNIDIPTAPYTQQQFITPSWPFHYSGCSAYACSLSSSPLKRIWRCSTHGPVAE